MRLFFLTHLFIWLVYFSCDSYSKAFTKLLDSELSTWHPKASKLEVWEVRSNLKSIEAALNQDNLEDTEKEHIFIIAQYYIAGPLVICKSVHCSRCDLNKFQRTEIIKILLRTKLGNQILDLLLADSFLKNNTPFLNELERIRVEQKNESPSSERSEHFDKAPSKSAA